MTRINIIEVFICAIMLEVNIEICFVSYWFDIANYNYSLYLLNFQGSIGIILKVSGWYGFLEIFLAIDSLPKRDKYFNDRFHLTNSVYLFVRLFVCIFYL